MPEKDQFSKTVWIDIPEEQQPVWDEDSTPRASKSSTVKKVRHLFHGSRDQKLLQAMYDGVLVTDRKGRMVEVNLKASHLFHCSQSDLSNVNILDLIHTGDQELLMAIEENLDAQRHVLLDVYCKRLDGTGFPSEIAVTPLEITEEGQLCFFIRDISERKRNEEKLLNSEQELRALTKQLEAKNRQLEASEKHLLDTIEQLRERENALAREQEFLQSLMDNIPDCIYFKDTESRFLRVNRALSKVKGLSNPDEAVGKSDFDFHDEAQARMFYEDDQQVIKTGTPIIGKVEKILRPDGSYRWSSTTKVPIRNEKNNIVGLVGVGRDITAWMRAEEEVKAAQSQIERARRLEATALFAGQIAHDLNNLLMPMFIFPTMIRKELKEGSQGWKNLDLITNKAHQIADIVKDLQALSRRGSAKQEEILDLNSAVEEVVESFRQGLAPEGIIIDCYPSSEFPNVRFGEPQLVRVLHNLCQNAIDAMGEQGHLIVKTENVYLDKPVTGYVSVNPGKYVLITVSDNGPGIPDDIRGQIFDPFFTTKNTRGKRGSGLGLSIVYGIVTDHDGYVDMETELGKGTTFSVYLSICRSEVPKKGQSKINKGTERMLGVDDGTLNGTRNGVQTSSEFI